MWKGTDGSYGRFGGSIYLGIRAGMPAGTFPLEKFPQAFSAFCAVGGDGTNLGAQDPLRHLIKNRGQGGRRTKRGIGPLGTRGEAKKKNTAQLKCTILEKWQKNVFYLLTKAILCDIINMSTKTCSFFVNYLQILLF